MSLRAPQAPFLVVNVPDVFSYKADLACIPGVRVFRGGYLWVPHHAVAIVTRELNRLGLSATRAYWGRRPLGAKKTWEQIADILRARVPAWVLDDFVDTYQKDALVHLSDQLNGHLWHVTGSGKTLTATLWARLNPGAIVVVTRGAARVQIAREFERFTALPVHCVRPRKSAEKKFDEYLSSTKTPIVVVGWESLPRMLPRLITLPSINLVFDEAHRGKSLHRWERAPLADTTDEAVIRAEEAEARRLGGFIKTDEHTGERTRFLPAKNMVTAASELAWAAQRRLCTTASPIKDRTRDLWGQLDLAEPGAWGAGGVWTSRYAGAKQGVYGWDTTGSSNLDELVERITPIVHRVGDDVVRSKLPAKTRKSFYVGVEDQVPPTGSWINLRKAAMKAGRVSLAELDFMRAASAKRQAVLSLIEDNVAANNKIVVFTARKRDCEDLGKLVASLKVKTWVAHGEKSIEARQDIVDEYMMTAGPCLLIATGDAFGESLNLHDTDAAIFVMLPYTPGALRQWEGRFCRRGQKRPVTITYVIAENTRDERVASILIDKLPAVETVTQDMELADARTPLSGITPEAVMTSILDYLDGVDWEPDDDDRMQETD